MFGSIKLSKKYGFISIILLINLILIISKINEIKLEKDETEIDDNSDTIDLNDEKRPKREAESDIIYVPIFHTNDIHGSFYKKEILLPDNQTFSQSGLEFLGQYIQIMKEEWRERLLYFDSGDIFQGGLEARISDGQIIMEFFNKLGLSNGAIGNHEYDYGIDFLKNFTNTSNFTFLSANVMERETGSFQIFPNQDQTAMIEMEGGIKIGVIGLETQETISSTTTNLDDYLFHGYPDIIRDKSSSLKKDGANAVIVLAHIGLYCDLNSTDDDNRLSYQVRSKSNKYETDCTDDDEAYIILKELNEDDIDLFLGGHKHTVSHHWINNIPVVTNDRNGKFADIIYLPFNKTNRKLIKDKIIMEGPLPICEKVFSSNKRCDMVIETEEDQEKYGNLSSYNFHGKLMEANKNITEIGEKYIEAYNEYDDDYLTMTLDHFESDKNQENAMGNFYTDFLRHLTGTDVSITNPGSFRTPFYRGNITNATIYNFDPFGNSIVTFKAKGKDLKDILYQVQAGKKGFYPVSGLKLSVQNSPKHKLLTASIYNGYKEEEIENEKNYTVTSNSFLFPDPTDKTKYGGDDFREVTQWFTPMDYKNFTIGDEYYNSRDLLINYLRNVQPRLEAKKYFDKDNPRMRIVNS